MQQSWDLNPVLWLKTPCPYPFCLFQAATQNHSAWCQADFTRGQTQGFLNLLICILSIFWQEGSNRTIWKYCPRLPTEFSLLSSHPWLLWQSPALLVKPQGTYGIYTKKHSCRTPLTSWVFLSLATTVLSLVLSALFLQISLKFHLCSLLL